MGLEAGPVLSSPRAMTHFVRNGRIVELVPSERAFTLRCIDTLTPTVVTALAAGNVQVLAADNRTGIIAVISPDGRMGLDRALAGAGLGDRVDVADAYIQPGGREDDPWTPTRRLTARFPKDFNRAAIDAILARHELEMVSEIKGMPNGYVLHVRKGDPIEIARALVEDDHLPEAEPDFIRRLVRRAHSFRS